MDRFPFEAGCFIKAYRRVVVVGHGEPHEGVAAVGCSLLHAIDEACVVTTVCVSCTVYGIRTEVDNVLLTFSNRPKIVGHPNLDDQ